MGNPNAMMRTILWWAHLLTGLLIGDLLPLLWGTVAVHPRSVSDGDEQRDGEDHGRQQRDRAGGVRGRRIVASLAIAGTLLLAYVLSPGLRADLGGVAASLGDAYAMIVENVILSFGAFAPVVFFLVMVAQVFIAPIPSAPVTLSGAIVFGVWKGFALSLTGSVVGSVLVFLAVRRWGEPLVARLVGQGIYRQYAGLLDDRGWWLCAVLLLPFTPDDGVVALAGLSTLSFRRFLVVMVLGRVPAAVLTVLLASDAVTGSTTAIFTAVLTIVALLSLGFVYRGRLEGWALGSAGDEQTSVHPVEVPRTVGA